MIQDNKNDVLNQRSPAPDTAMFGVPGVGHSKPALLSPGISLSPVYLISYLCRKLLSRFNLSS